MAHFGFNKLQLLCTNPSLSYLDYDDVIKGQAFRNIYDQAFKKSFQERLEVIHIVKCCL